MDKMIFDRAQSDVDYAKQIKDDILNGGTIPPEYLLGLKGSLNFTDLNRIEDACKYLCDELNKYSYKVDISTYSIPDTRTEIIHVDKDVTETIGTYNVNGTTTATGSDQLLTIPTDGTYTITAYGAEGGVGNPAGYGSIAGKGAKLSSKFELKQGDIIHICVGKQGTGSGVGGDGASGGGGGATFVFKEIPSITDSRYQFTKNSKNYEVLLVSAGGGGTWDEAYKKSRGDGYHGVGASWYSPSNYVAWTTNTNSGSSSYSVPVGYGISQYISYDLKGCFYTRNSSTGQGGYGGGTATDDYNGCGGAWYSSGYIAYSWSSGISTSGITGSRSGNGYCLVERTYNVQEDQEVVIPFTRYDWVIKDEITIEQLNRIRTNIRNLYNAFYVLPDWIPFLNDSVVGFEHINVLEWDLHIINVWLCRMISNFKYSGTFYSGGGIL